MAAEDWLGIVAPQTLQRLLTTRQCSSHVLQEDDYITTAARRLSELLPKEVKQVQVPTCDRSVRKLPYRHRQRLFYCKTTDGLLWVIIC